MSTNTDPVQRHTYNIGMFLDIAHMWANDPASVNTVFTACSH